MGDWTTTRVENRLESAADVFRTLSGIMPHGFFNAYHHHSPSPATISTSISNFLSTRQSNS